MNRGIVFGLRVLALVIDIAVGFAIIGLSIEGLNFFLKMSSSGTMALFGLMSFPILLVTPIIFMGITTGIWGRTIGKWICRLQVTGESYQTIGIWKGLGREFLKVLMFISQIGFIIYLIQIYSNGKVLHDSLC